MTRWPKLHTLNLSDCLLRPKGGVSLMTTLASGSNPLLRSLKLQSNELDHRAIALLATTITTHLEHLVDLELNGNRGEPDDDCYEQVRAALLARGHEDALDELDELEEAEDDDEDDEDEDAAEEEEEEESEVVKKDDEEEAKEPARNEEKESDELADLLGKVHIA